MRRLGGAWPASALAVAVVGGLCGDGGLEKRRSRTTLAVVVVVVGGSGSGRILNTLVGAVKETDLGEPSELLLANKIWAVLICDVLLCAINQPGTQTQLRCSVGCGQAHRMAGAAAARQ